MLRGRLRRRAVRLPCRGLARCAGARELGDRGREDPDVVLPVEPVLAAQVVLSREGEAYAEFYRLDLFAPELFGGEDADGAFAFRGVVGGRDGDVDPDEAREVADLGRWLDGGWGTLVTLMR